MSGSDLVAPRALQVEQGAANGSFVTDGMRLPLRPYRCRSRPAFQELAGDSTLQMTMRYMHLAPMVLLQAIELLNVGQQVGNAEMARV